MFKVCTRCNAEKDLSEFYYDKTVTKYQQPCKECKSASGKQEWSEDGHNRKAWGKRYQTTQGRAVNLVNNAKSRAKTKGIEFDLSSEWVKKHLDTGKCAVTGIPFDFSAGVGIGNGRAFGPSLDRIDPTRGYTQDNIQVVCWLYNRAKGVQSHAEVMAMAEALCQKS